jgi:hypothetical protein
MKRKKMNNLLYEKMIELNKRYNSPTAIGRLLNLSRSKVMYWLGKGKHKPKFRHYEEIEQPKDYTYRYRDFILKDDWAYDCENPRELGKILRKDYKLNYGRYPKTTC